MRISHSFNKNLFTGYLSIRLFLLCLFISVGIQAQNTYNVASGNWSTAANWSLGHIPASGESVIIPAGRSVTVDATTIPATGTLASLDISGSLTYSAATARTITVAGNVMINSGGSFSSAASGTVLTHTLSVAGNIINNGTLDFSTASGAAGARITFTGSANQTVSGTGTVTDLTSITMSKAALDITGATNVVEFNLSNFTVQGTSSGATGSLLTTATGTGTLKFSGTNTFDGTLWSVPGYTIPATLSFWLNNPNFTVLGQAGSPTLTGMLRISSGTYNVGTGAGNTITGGASTSIFNIEGGTFNASGRLNMTGASSTYTQTGGTVNVCTVGNASGTLASFQVAGNFNLSGGTIILNQPASGTTQLDYNVSSASPVITGGLLQAGFSGTPASSVYTLRGTAPNTVLDNSSGANPGIVIGAATTVRGDMTLNGSGTFTKGAVAFTMAGNSIANPGNIIVNGTNTLTLNGAGALSFSSSFGNQSLTLGSGTITSNQLNSLTINNTFSGGTVTLPTGLTMINGTTLTLTSGIVNTSLLTLGTTAAVTVSGGNSNSFINGALIRTFSASTSAISAANLFPVGKGTTYLPLNLGPTLTGLVQLKAEAFLANSGTNASPSGTLSPHRWEASVITNPGNLTSVIMQENDATISVTNIILRSTSAAGTYRTVTPASTATAGVSLVTASTMTAAEFNGSGFFSFGDGCSSEPTFTGPQNIAVGATSQWLASTAGTWSSLTPSIATVDASGNITGVSAGTATLAFTASTADICNGVQVTTTVNIVTMTATPGGVGSNLISWYKGNTGLTTTTWPDQIGGNTMTNVGAITVSNTPIGMNFNPAAVIGSSAYYRNLAATGWLGGTTATTYFTVANFASGLANRPIIGRGSVNGTDTSFHIGMTSATLPFASGDVGVAPTSPIAMYPPVGITRVIRGGFLGGSGVNYYISTDGLAEATATPATPTIAATAPFYIGRSATLGNTWSGIVSEVIAYNGKLSSSEYDRIQSYLALKYGLTLNNTATTSYIASNGTTKMWDATVAGAYVNDIFGIGKDNGSGLDQRISTSVNAASVVVLSTDNDFTSTNTSHTDALSNMQFLSAAHNGAIAYWSIAGNLTGYNTMTRVWKVTNTGSVASVNIQFNVSSFPIPTGSASYYLIVDPNGDGDYSDGTPVLMTNTSGSLWSATGISMPNGALFTLASVKLVPTTYPGGITDAAIWLKADAGVGVADGAPVNGWVDQSGNRVNNASGIGELSVPTFSNTGTGLINFNPSLTFTNTNGLNYGNDYITTANANGGVHLFSAVKPASNVRGYPFIFDFGGFAGDSYGFGYSNSRIFMNTPEPFSARLVAMANPLNSTDAVICDFDVNFNPSGGLYINTNGLQNASLAVANIADLSNVQISDQHTAGRGPMTIGRQSKADGFTSDRAFLGQMGEFIHYNRNLSATEIQRVRSYLALKYGNSLDQTTAYSYIASDGTTVMWNASAATGIYTQNIFGIGQDNLSGLDQRISKSANTGSILTLSTDTNFTNINTSHSAISTGDKTFFTISDNGGSTALATVAISGIQAISPGLKNINKVWLAQDKGGFGCLNYQFDTSSFDQSVGKPWYIITANDAAFTTNVEYKKVTVSSALTLAMNLPDNMASYFTFAQFDRNLLPNVTGNIVGISTTIADWQQPTTENVHLEIQSKDLAGIVITRINGTAAVTDPKEGMLIFDTSDNKFKINTNGTSSGWREIGNLPPSVKFCN